MLYRLGKLVAAHPLLFIAIWIVGAAGVTVLVKTVGANTDNSVSLPGTGSQAATDLLEAGFPPQQNGSNPVIFHVTKGKVTDKDNKSAITSSYKAIKKIPYVHSATSPFAQGAGAQISKDKKTAFISVLLDVNSNDLTTEEAQRVLDAADPGTKAGMEVVGGGSIATVLSPNDTSTSDLIGILAAMLILTLTFGTVVAMGMPIGTAVLGLTTALGLIGLLGHLISVPGISHTVATMIGLAVGIDYALFLVTRHRAQLSEGVELHESIARSVGHRRHRSRLRRLHRGGRAGVAGRRGHPAGLGARLHLRHGSGDGRAGGHHPAAGADGVRRQAHQLAARCRPGCIAARIPTGRGCGVTGRRSSSGRPWIPILISAAILVPLMIPVLSLQLGQENIGQTDPSTMERRAYDLMASGFGPGFNGPLIIAVALAPGAKPDPAVIAQENQLKALQKQLDKEQKQGKQMQAELEAGQAQLEQQQAQLEKQQAQLEAQQAQLENQAAALQAQQASLEAQAAQLQQQRDALKAEAEALAAQARVQARRLVEIRIHIRRVERKIANTTNPNRLARLEREAAPAAGRGAARPLGAAARQEAGAEAARSGAVAAAAGGRAGGAEAAARGAGGGASAPGERRSRARPTRSSSRPTR